MARSNRDFYPTTPCAAMAIGDALRRMVAYGELHPDVLDRDRWTDPAGGFGTLLDWASIPFANRSVLELGNEDFVVRELSARVPNFVTGFDSLVGAWPENDHILGNPPFDLLDEFVRRAVSHHLMVAQRKRPHVWAVWTHPQRAPGTRWERLERPAVPQAWLDEHDRLARLAAGRAPVNQLALGLSYDVPELPHELRSRFD